jgi:hypothetical protein
LTLGLVDNINTYTKFFNIKMNKKQKITAILFLVILIGFGVFFFIKSKPNESVTSEAIEPDVPISAEVESSVLGSRSKTSPTISPTPSSKNSTNGANNISGTTNNDAGSNGNSNGQTNTSSNPESIETISDLNVFKSVKSPDGKYYIVLSMDSTTAQNHAGYENKRFFQNLVSKAFAAEQVSDAYTLKIADSNGVVSDTLESGKVTDVAFVGNEEIYYQIIGTGAGIYNYNIKTKEKTVLIYSYDTNAFENFVQIDDSKFFFIQPATGKIGFGKAGSTDVTVLDEKVLNTKLSYVKSSAFKFASLSPDKKYIVLYDLDPDEAFKVRILIYPVTAMSTADLYFETRVNYPAGGFRNENDAFSWSKDSQYVTGGNNGAVIDVLNKKVVFESTEGNISKLSPDATKILSFEQGTGLVKAVNLNNEELATLPSGISQIEWLTNDYAILIIGQRLYIYKVSAKSLNAVNDIQTSYEIQSVDPLNGKALVRGGKILYEVSKR